MLKKRVAEQERIAARAVTVEQSLTAVLLTLGLVGRGLLAWGTAG